MKTLVALAISAAAFCAVHPARAEMPTPSSDGLSHFLAGENLKPQAAPVCGWISCYDYCQKQYVWLRGGRCYYSWDSWTGCYKAYTYCR